MPDDEHDPEEIAEELRTIAKGLESGDATLRQVRTRPVLTKGPDAVDIEVDWHA